MRHDDHPLIHFVDGPSGRRAAVIGTGLDVWEVVATVRDNGNDLEEAAEYLGVSADLVDAAVGYFGAYREEIEAEIALNKEEWRRGYRAVRGGTSRA